MDTWGRDLVEPNIRQVAGDLPIHLGTFRQLLEDSSDIDARSATSIFESVVYMRNTLLRDADQAGMAHSVEIRVPFVDAELADFALSLPPGVRRATRSPKPLLSAAMADRLDRAWIDRPKMGFSLPFDEWLRGPLRGEVESALETLSGRPLRGHAARAAWDGFLRGDRRLRAGHILSLYVLGRWMQMNGVERGHAVAPEELMSPCTS
jgi:asparagine synthase (glutamine-hydrolysing)